MGARHSLNLWKCVWVWNDGNFAEWGDGSPATITVVFLVDFAHEHQCVKETDQEDEGDAEGKPEVDDGEVGDAGHGGGGSREEGGQHQESSQGHHDAIIEVLHVKEKRNIGDDDEEQGGHVDPQQVVAIQVLEGGGEHNTFIKRVSEEFLLCKSHVFDLVFQQLAAVN